MRCSVPVKPIVLVEDDPHHADLIMEALRSTPVANPIVTLSSGAEALAYFFGDPHGEQPRLAERECPCLVILDLRLPDMPGFEVLRRLKGNRVYELLPVMVLTTSADERDIKRGYDLQANAYVTKPVEFQELFHKVSQAGLYWVMVNEPLPA